VKTILKFLLVWQQKGGEKEVRRGWKVALLTLIISCSLQGIVLWRYSLTVAKKEQISLHTVGSLHLTESGNKLSRVNETK